MAQKIALVTGAGSGIGKSVTLALLREGYCVVLAGRRLETLQLTIRESGCSPEQALAVSTDVCDPASVDALFTQIRTHYGRLDILFNNAGKSAPAVLFEDLNPADWLSVVNLNLNGAFFCAQAAFRLMKEQMPQGGRIINNGSISAHVPRPNSAPYTASKHAITGLTRSIALDGRKYHIACGQIDIGNAATDMTQKMQHGILQANGDLAPEPVMDVTHVAAAVLYMASLPLDANVPFMTVMATQMPYIGRG